MTLLWATLIGVCAYAARLYVESCKFTPDGAMYIRAAMGEAVPRPYATRWLLPALLGANGYAWHVCSACALVATCPLLAWYLEQRELGDVALLGVLLWVGLPGIWRLGVKYPVLVDAPALALALLAACLCDVAFWAAIPVALVAGAVSEKAPVWAAVFAWSPAPLVGLLVVSWLMFRVTPGGDVPDWLRQPLHAARAFHQQVWTDWRVTIAPWGAVLPLAVLSGEWTSQLGAACALGYGQLLIANDSVRLYQWAAPCLLVAALAALPSSGVPLLILAHLVNPWAEKVEV